MFLCVYNAHMFQSTQTITMPTIEQLESKRDSLLKQFADIGELRPGSLLPNFRKCGKPSCYCAEEGAKGHPGWRLSRKVNDKSVSRGIPAHALEVTREQVEHYHHFKDLVREFIEVNESLCDLRLKAGRGKKKPRTKNPQANLRG